jgi:hypothetical protein
MPFSIDIDGQTRTGSWDIGADEYIAPITTTTTTTIEPTTSTTTIEPTTSTTTIEPTTSTTTIEPTTTTTTIEPTTTTTTIEPTTSTTTIECQTHFWYRDRDEDTYGNADNATLACAAPEGYVDNSTGFDCNDNASAVNPGAEEVCNGIDDDCDDAIDEGLDNCPPDNCTDADGDGYFAGEGCTPFDCDDTDWTMHEGCEAAPCTLQIIPKQIFKVAGFFEPVVPYIISAESDSGIDFGTFSVAFNSDFIHCLTRIKLGPRIIIGLYVFNPFKVEKGDAQVNIIIYGSSPDTRCADFTIQ